MRASFFRVLSALVPVVAALVAFPRPLDAQELAPRPFLWRIDGPAPSYVFGTIHLPDERVTNLHPAVEAALDEADAVYTELPMDMETMMEAAREMALPGRTSLKDVLPDALYERLKKFLADRGMPIAPLSKLKVWAIATQIPLIEHLKEIASGQPLDMLLYNRARDEEKETGGLETVDEQVGVFDGLSTDEQVQLLEDSMDQVEELDAKGEDILDKTIRLYVAGDAEALMDLMHESASEDDALQLKIEEALLWKRNRLMADRIAEKIRSAPDRSFFFAVGAAHMPTDRGVIALLRGKGFEVARLPETAAEVEARIRELEQRLESLRARLRELRKAG